MQFDHTTAKSQCDNTGFYKGATKNSETFTNRFNLTVFLTVVLQKPISLLFYNKGFLCYLVFIQGDKHLNYFVNIYST